MLHGSSPSVSQPGRGSRHTHVQDKWPKSFFQPEESWLCEMCPVKPVHMVALAVENFMCIIRLPALLSVTAGRSL